MISIVLNFFTAQALSGYTKCVMKSENKDILRALLTKQLEELISEAGKTVHGMSGAKEEHFPDPTDRASLETDRNFLLRVKDRERKLILKIQETLAKVDDEEYGICDFCGEEISLERLKVRPVATSCIACKTEEEENEKARPGL